jgi:hypothetical protein
MSDDDPRGIPLRVARILKGVEFLAQPKFGFLDRNPKTKEYEETVGPSVVTSVIRAPSRRNVALQSIFSSMEPSQESKAPLQPPPPTTTLSTGSQLMENLSSPLTTHLGPTDFNDFSSLFTSIWTPLDPEASSRPPSEFGGDKIDQDGWN